MEIFQHLVSSTTSWFSQAPAGEDALQQLLDASGLDFPIEYLELLRFSNGGSGSLAVHPLWFNLYAAEEVIQINKDFEIAKFLPGYFAFGSNGANELLVFKIWEPKPWKIYYTPMIVMEVEATLECAPDFMTFISYMGHSCNS